MKHLILLPILFSVCTTLVAQTAEEDAARLVTYTARINYFGRLCPQEKVYLHFDNTAYFQGETIWYAAYITDDTNKPEPASKVLYVELLSPTGVILKQHKLKIEHGRCHGSFALVDTSVKEAIERRGAAYLPSGYYQIRAYTRAMLNFDDATVFSRIIPVFQSPEREGRYEKPAIGKYPYREVNRPEMPKNKSKEVTVTFFPEGGHLIAGISCAVAFKVTDENGLGINIDRMWTESGQDIAISSLHRGMGRFEWLTQKGGETLLFCVGDKEYKCTHPQAEEQGCALHLVQKRDSLVVHIDAVGMTKDSLLAFTLTERGRVWAFDILHIFDKIEKNKKQPVSLDIMLPTDSIPTGVCQFTLFNPSGDILAQRMLFIDNGIKTIPVSFTATKPEYRPFERIQMTFQTEGYPYRTFSLAVRDAADYGTAYADDIRTYMLLSSELKGLIEDPGWYFEELGMRNEVLGIKNEKRVSGERQEVNDNDNVNDNDANNPNPSPLTPNQSPNSSDRKSALDLLMMVQGWTRYDWQQMAGVTPFKVRHYTEQQLVLDGWAFSRILEKPLQNTKVYIRLCSRDEPIEQRTTVTTDKDGYWSVGLEDFEGKWDLYYHTEQENENKKNATTRIRLERSYKPSLYAYTPIETYLPDHETSNALLPTWREDISDFVMPHDAIPLDEVEVKASVLYVDYGTFHAYDAAEACEDIFDEGDYTYNLQEYLYRIGFFEDRYNSTVYDTRVHRYIVKSYEIGPSDTLRWMELTEDMEYIESVFIYDTLSVDPRLIPSFKAYYNRFEEVDYLNFIEWLMRGDKFLIAEVKYGKGGFSERRGKNDRYTTFSGYTKPVEFYAPTYPNGPVQGDKDYRRTIYWNPEVTTDADGHASVSFYNNGYSRALTVSAEGLTPDGIPIVNK